MNVLSISRYVGMLLNWSQYEVEPSVNRTDFSRLMVVMFLDIAGTIMLTGLGLDPIMLGGVYSVDSFRPTIKSSP